MFRKCEADFEGVFKDYADYRRLFTLRLDRKAAVVFNAKRNNQGGERHH